MPMADPNKAFGGRQSNMGKSKVFTCLNTSASLWQWLGFTKVFTFSRPRKWLHLLVELCDLSWMHHSLKLPCIISSQKFEVVQKDMPYFSQTTHNWDHCRYPKQSFISAISAWKIYIKAMTPNPFVTADLSKLDNFTAAREYSCNS